MFSPERDKEGNPIIRLHAIPAPINEHARLTGCFSCTNSATVDYTLTEARLLDGASYVYEGSIGAKITLQVVHPQAGVVDEFVTDYYLLPHETIRLYKAKLSAGLTIRLIFTGVGEFRGNLYLHEVVE